MTTLTDSGQGMDVAIGGLGFRLAVNKERAYERATAQFRKEQFDSAATVGDQSLTGWWTRGQMSFHKGAGVTYYEVLDGETVLDRFSDSDAIDIPEPGTVTLLPRLGTSALAGLLVSDAVPAPLSAGAGVYALTATGIKYSAGASYTSIPTSNAGVPTSIASSGARYYAANGAIIERQTFVEDARTNHVTNPSFETTLTGWTATNATLTRSPASGADKNAKYGTRSAVVAVTTSGGGVDATVSGLTIGETYLVSVWVLRALDTNQHVRLTFGGSVMGTTTGAARVWERLSGTFVATATSHTLSVTSTGAGTVPTFNLDAVMVTESPYDADYFDGSQPGCAWAGTPHASKSTYATSSGDASAARVTLTGDTWDKVFWAKGRIWAVDNSGRWYARADTTATIATTDAFWSSGNAEATWTLTEGTGPVYISDGFDIFTVTVDVDGVVPALSAPTTAARMPLGEKITSLTYYLGYLIITTTRGVRVAQTQDNLVLLGPLIIEGDFSSAVRTGIYGSRAYVAGRISASLVPDGVAPTLRSTADGGDSVLCVIDLAHFVEDLQPAWWPLDILSTLASGASGAAIDANGVIYAFAATLAKRASVDELSESGTLVTGWHRFGTLEPKYFHSVTVRMAGSGTITVTRIDADDTETSLGSVTESGTVALGLTESVERLALKFTLERSATDQTAGPRLLGYQIKALPAPVRQRMIRVPLLCMDEESRGGTPATGYDGSAYDRLTALEAMEASGGVHDYQDFRTGEAGTVFIESIEHRGTTPPSAQSDGYGGIVWVTLRKLD